MRGDKCKVSLPRRQTELFVGHGVRNYDIINGHCSDKQNSMKVSHKSKRHTRGIFFPFYTRMIMRRHPRSIILLQDTTVAHLDKYRSNY